MRKWDIRQPLPEDLVGAYDVVHIRNFAFVLRDRDISQILHKLVKMISKTFEGSAPTTFLH